MQTWMLVAIGIFLLLGVVVALFRVALSYVVGLVLLAGIGYGVYWYYTSEHPQSQAQVEERSEPSK